MVCVFRFGGLPPQLYECGGSLSRSDEDGDEITSTPKLRTSWHGLPVGRCRPKRTPTLAGFAPVYVFGPGKGYEFSALAC